MVPLRWWACTLKGSLDRISERLFFVCHVSNDFVGFAVFQLKSRFIVQFIFYFGPLRSAIIF